MVAATDAGELIDRPRIARAMTGCLAHGVHYRSGIRRGDAPEVEGIVHDRM